MIEHKEEEELLVLFHISKGKRKRKLRKKASGMDMRPLNKLRVENGRFSMLAISMWYLERIS